MLETCRSGGKILLCGNDGSAADCSHIAGELLKSFRLPRPLPQEIKNFLDSLDFGCNDSLSERLSRGIAAVSLPNMTSALTAEMSDVGADAVYAQQVAALARPGDTLLCISTSGNAKSVAAAAITARAFGIRVCALTGALPSRLSEICDVCIRVPERETYRVQELHLPVYHYLCAELEKILFQ